MKKIALPIDVFIILIILILPCNAIAAEKPQYFCADGKYNIV